MASLVPDTYTLAPSVLTSVAMSGASPPQPHLPAHRGAVRHPRPDEPESIPRIFLALEFFPGSGGLIGLGFAVNLTGAPLPGALTDAVDMMVRAALPAALFGLGGVLYRYRPEGDAGTIVMICAVSLILHPTITYTLGRAFDLDRDALRSAVVTAAMAPGINTYLFANMYGVARRVAASGVLIGTALSLITVWVWLAILP